MQYLIPALEPAGYDEAAVLGSISWLWSHSAAHQGASIFAFMGHVLPALQHRQFALGTENGRPVFYAAWAYFNETTEQRYADHPQSLQATDWKTGERLWVIDWITPFGHGPQAVRLFRCMFPHACARALRFKSARGISQYKEYRGNAVNAEQARTYAEQHPLLSPA